MKFLLWTIAVIAVAVGLVTAALRSSAGYLQIVWPPYRTELSLVMVVVILAAAFALAYLLVRLLVAVVGMPQQVREYREARRKTKAQAAIAGALHEFFSGRFARAERAAQQAMSLDEQPGLAAMLAARAAHELRAMDRRDAYLAQAAAHLPPGDTMTVMAEAQWLLNAQRGAEALALLQAQPQPHTAGLRLEFEALQQAKEWEKSLALIDQLERRKVFDAEQAARLRTHAWAAHLTHCASDLPTLDEAWRKVPEALRRDTVMAPAAAQAYVRLQAGARAADIIERSLAQTWDSGLAALYGACADGADVVPYIERAERWLVAHPQDASLLLTLGRLCAQQALWGKARNYIDAAIAVDATYQSHLAAARLHEKLGDPDAAQQHYRRSLDLALAKLGEQA